MAWHEEFEDAKVIDGRLALPSIPVLPLLVPAERIFEVDDLCLPAFEINTQDIETHLRRELLRQLPYVSASQSAQRISLVAIDGDFRGCCISMGRARLHFAEQQQRPLPCDQVHIAGYVAGRPAPRHDSVTIAPQMEVGGVFAFESDPGDGGAAPTHGR